MLHKHLKSDTQTKDAALSTCLTLHACQLNACVMKECVMRQTGNQLPPLNIIVKDGLGLQTNMLCKHPVSVLSQGVMIDPGA